jgi:VWFA-related protein
MHIRWSGWLALLAIAALAFAPAPQAQDEAVVQVTQIDRSQFPTVQVYVSVTDAEGMPLPVPAEAVQLFENGEPVRLEAVAGQGEIGPLTTLLVIDVSGSMAVAGKLKAAQAAANAYVDQMREGDQAGVLAFNVESDLLQPITRNRQALHTAIDALETHDDTALYDALLEGVALLESIQGRKAIIALTDGMDNSSAATLDRVVTRTTDGGLSISAIGLGDRSQLGVSFAGLDDEALKQMAENAGGSFGLAADQASLTRLYQRLGRALQSEYRLTYTTQSPLRDGLNRQLTVRLGDRAAAAEAAYNPGGVLPEVATYPSWVLFLAGLALLVVLMVLPGVIRMGSDRLRKPEPSAKAGKPKAGRIRLGEEAKPSAQRRVKLR